MAKTKPAEGKQLYRVRDGFVAHIIGRDPVEGGDTVELDDDEAKFYAAQIELADPPAEPAAA